MKKWGSLSIIALEIGPFEIVCLASGFSPQKSPSKKSQGSYKKYNSPNNADRKVYLAARFFTGASIVFDITMS